jgi:rubrerythrin
MSHSDRYEISHTIRRCGDGVFRDLDLDDRSLAPLCHLRVCVQCGTEFRARTRNGQRCPLCEDVASISQVG